MLLRLSRLSIGLAAAAGGLMAFGPPELRSLGGDLALALAAAAFGLWRVAVALDRRLTQPVAAVAPLALDAAWLADAEGVVTRAAAEAASFEAALLETAAALRGELGARAARVYLLGGEPDRLSACELIADRPGFRSPARALDPSSPVLARAAREQRVCLDLPRVLAVPVLRHGMPVALLELTGLELRIDEAALAALLSVARDALGERADQPAAVQPRLVHRWSVAVRPAAQRVAPGAVPC
jgi:hypothetical protein